MKFWITASNINEKQWHSWISLVLDWTSEVKIHSILNYKVEHSFIAVFTYEYEYLNKVNKVKYKITSLENAQGICHTDGLIDMAIGTPPQDGTFLYTHFS